VTEQRPFVVRLVGTALQSPTKLPGLLNDERKRIENQVRVAHWIGEMAVTMGRKQLTRRLSGVLPSSSPAPASAGHTATPATAAHPPFDGYDDLPATEVVALLAKVPHSDLALIRDYEVAGRGRTTILHRIDSLLAEA